jgi:hypothetical protein
LKLWDFETIDKSSQEISGSLSVKAKFSDCQTDLERASYLEDLLIEEATGGRPNADEYRKARSFFVQDANLQARVPEWLLNHRTIDHFWDFIKYKYGTYHERREFIRSELAPLHSHLEFKPGAPHADYVGDAMSSISPEYVLRIWNKALNRIPEDPDGAITSARELMEAVLKHLADDVGVTYGENPDLHDLYKSVAEELNLTPEQHEETLFRQILGSCSGVVSGIGRIRNVFGDAHGKSSSTYRPSGRHARLAVNMAGTMCLFLIETVEARAEA